MDCTLDILAIATLVTPQGDVAPGARVSLPEDEARSLVAAGLASLAPEEPAAAPAQPQDHDDEGAVVAHAAGLDPAEIAAEADEAEAGKKARRRVN